MTTTKKPASGQPTPASRPKSRAKAKKAPVETEAAASAPVTEPGRARRAKVAKPAKAVQPPKAVKPVAAAKPAKPRKPRAEREAEPAPEMPGVAPEMPEVVAEMAPPAAAKSTPPKLTLAAPLPPARGKVVPFPRPVSAPAVTDAQIAERAYFIWLAEGCPDGRAQEHWARAQRELTQTGTHVCAS